MEECSAIALLAWVLEEREPDEECGKGRAMGPPGISQKGRKYTVLATWLSSLIHIEFLVHKTIRKNMYCFNSPNLYNSSHPCLSPFCATTIEKHRLTHLLRTEIHFSQAGMLKIEVLGLASGEFSCFSPTIEGRRASQPSPAA